MTEKIPTTERLAKAMREHDCPEYMIEKALAGYYDDYKSPIPTPCTKLIAELGLVGALDLQNKAINGEFDAQKWEAEEWANSPEGKKVFSCFPSGVRKKLFGV